MRFTIEHIDGAWFVCERGTIVAGPFAFRADAISTATRMESRP